MFGGRVLRVAATNDPHRILPPYARLRENLARVRSSTNLTGIPLTLAEKILYSHIDYQTALLPNDIRRGETYLKLRPDRVAMQDASAQMALLQFMLCGRQSTAVPTTIHCDHLIQATRSGADKDVAQSVESEREIYDFLKGAAERYGIGFWKPGSGIIHQIVLENYAAPGTMMLGTDSHTPNAGGLGTLAIGVGGADAVDAMADISWELKAPKILGVLLTGQLSGWASPKDVILKLAGELSVRGGTGFVLEYFGPGVESLSCTGMATICNMGAEVGATTSIFPYTKSMKRYLEATGRGFVAEAADANQNLLVADPGSHRRYDAFIPIDLSTLEPHINGPFTPDASVPLSKFQQQVIEQKWPQSVSAALIGSCTNSSYEDMTRATSIVRQAVEKGVGAKTEFFITPGSEQIRATIDRDGFISTFEEAGATVLANACGPCIGQWKRDKETTNAASPNVILTSFNRNFRGRNDGNSQTMNFLASPEIVSCFALSGSLLFNPMTDFLEGQNGEKVKLEPPSGQELPDSGFSQGRETYRPPAPTLSGNPAVSPSINPSSSRLQALQPFSAWNGKELTDMLVLVKVRGKCTTDHISAAGPWLKFKGHLDNIANNTLIGAVNDDNGQVNSIENQLSGDKNRSIPDVARYYKANHQPWLIIADHNYGEGSAREHAALQPRYLGGSVIVAKSFARIHETNLKKQGMLPLTFEREEDYEKIPATGVQIDTVGLVEAASSSTPETHKIHLRIRRKQQEEGKEELLFEIPMKHTMSRDQMEWFKHGSALNMMRDRQQQQQRVKVYN